MEIKEIRDLLNNKEQELTDLNEKKSRLNDERIIKEQEIVILEGKLRYCREKVPYCPSCGCRCRPSVQRNMFECSNRKCEDYQTEWVWSDNYHGELRRH